MDKLKEKIEKKFSDVYIDLENSYNDKDGYTCVPINFHSEVIDHYKLYDYLRQNKIGFMSVLDQNEEMKCYLKVNINRIYLNQIHSFGEIIFYIVFFILTFVRIILWIQTQT